MAGRYGLVAFASVALAITVATASRTILTTQEGTQYDLGDVQTIHRTLMSDLKKAQEAAGIFVDDAHLFEKPLSGNNRRLQQSGGASPLNLLSNSAILNQLTALLSTGNNIGSFPGVSLGLPGGSSLGYAPTDNSYCLFSTQPYAGAPGPSINGLPAAFTCVDAALAPPNSFIVNYGGNSYACTGTAGQAPSSGRKLQQAPSPVGDLFGSLLASIGFPVWNCVVATTPDGNTTVGQATEAVLNDLGVVAEHLLFYLNADDSLTYEQEIKNSFVSLTNPLYPTGPRINVSIDFAEVAKDTPLLESIFRTPAPTPPPTTPATVKTPPTPNSPTTTSPPGSPAPTTGGSPGTTVSAGGTTTTTSTSDQSTTVTVQAPGTDFVVTVPTVTRLTAFDGYLDNCQTVVGTVPHVDGNFDRTNNFTTVITEGVSNMTTTMVNELAGQVAYVVPASKVIKVDPITLANRKSAKVCYDIATLQPVYNPLATFILPNATGLAASPASTVTVFGNAFGLTTDALVQALGIQLPENKTLQSYDALAAATNGSGVGLAVLKKNVQLANLVTAGANLLTNDTVSYASYAIIMDQAIAKKILYSPPTGGRRLLQDAPAMAPVTSSGDAAVAVNLANGTTVASIIDIAQSLIPTLDQATQSALNQNLTPDQKAAVGAAVGNLNSWVAAAPGATETELGQYYAEAKLAPQINQLATGAITLDEFKAATTSDAISKAISTEKLPGQLIPTPTLVVTNTTTLLPITQSNAVETSSTSSGGLSTGGTVALATVLPIVGVIAIIAAVAYYISRKNRANVDSPNNSGVWWRRPFARGSPSGSPIAGPSAAV